MGWWSTEIMGGDTPYDWLGDIKEALGVEEFDDEEKDLLAISPDLLTENQVMLVSLIDKAGEDREIGLQALAWLMIKNGAKISDESKVIFLKAIDEDQWAKTDQERQKEITAFSTVLQNYNGIAVDLDHAGLLSTIADHFFDGDEGLVNKNI